MAQAISIFDIFKIGVGPSSSHTLGPWKAALSFLQDLEGIDIDQIRVHLFGSLSKTGKGHATDSALILGLLGHDPVTIDPSSITQYIKKVKMTRRLKHRSTSMRFDPVNDIIFEPFAHDLHPNTMKFVAFKDGVEVKEEWIISVGGGFIEKPSSVEDNEKESPIPYPIRTGAEILKYTEELNYSISALTLHNEVAWRPLEVVCKRIDNLYDVMVACVHRGCTTSGTLPGGLEVSRRAKGISQSLLGNTIELDIEEWLAAIKTSTKSYDQVNQWVSCFALAVNEENAAMGRVVTSPTNGAAGVIPAVLLYHMILSGQGKPEDIRKFLLVAGEIGCLFKKGATISAAVGGCQAEIGVSSAMAAAGLTEVLGGSTGR